MDRPNPPRRRELIHYAICAEAMVMLIIGRLLVLLLPLRKITALLQSGGTADANSAKGADAQDIALIRRGLDAASRRLPIRTLCFERGIAAMIMLRRRKAAARFHYGVGHIEQSLAAHVWVTSGAHGVTGHENADQFREIIAIE